MLRSWVCESKLLVKCLKISHKHKIERQVERQVYSGNCAKYDGVAVQIGAKIECVYFRRNTLSCVCGLLVVLRVKETLNFVERGLVLQVHFAFIENIVIECEPKSCIPLLHFVLLTLSSLVTVCAQI